MSIIRFKAATASTYNTTPDTSSMLSSMFTSVSITSPGSITLTLASPYYLTSSAGGRTTLVNYSGQLIYYSATAGAQKVYSIPSIQTSGTAPFLYLSTISPNTMIIQSMVASLVSSPSLSDTSSIFYTGSEYYGILLIMTFYN
jgi:hypothetical protein